jgi:hypothetical protein
MIQSSRELTVNTAGHRYDIIILAAKALENFLRTRYQPSGDHARAVTDAVFGGRLSIQVRCFGISNAPVKSIANCSGQRAMYHSAEWYTFQRSPYPNKTIYRGIWQIWILLYSTSTEARQTTSVHEHQATASRQKVEPGTKYAATPGRCKRIVMEPAFF